MEEPGPALRQVRLRCPGSKGQHASLELDVDGVGGRARHDGPQDDVVGGLVDVEGQVIRAGR